MKMKIGFEIIILATMITLGGCTTPPSSTPTFMVADVQSIRNIDSITLLPIVTNLDVDKGKSAELSARLHKELAVELALKGYVLEKSDTFSDRAKIPASAVDGLGIERLSLLGPVHSKYLLICYLRDYDKSNALIMKDTDIYLSAVLIDKRSKRILWKNEGTGDVSSLGALMTLFWNDDPEVIKQGLANLFSAFPDKDMY